MKVCTLSVFSCLVMTAAAWSLPFYPVPQGPPRITRFAPPPYRIPVRVAEDEAVHWQQRPKRNHHDHDDYDFDHDHHRDHHHDHHHDHSDHDDKGVTGPVHTFVKTDKNANYKWGVRHHVGNKFAS